jgi:sortase A
MGGDKLKNTVFRIMGIVLLVIGLASISYGIYYKWETSKVQQILINDFERVMKNMEEDKIVAPEEKGITVEEANVNNISIEPIAILEIPKIALKVAVASGTSDKTISQAVGHFTETALPGQVGNCALVGHRNFTTGEFFLKLDKLKPGDDVILTTYGNTYVYKVTGQQVVNPGDVQVLNATPTPTITLVTCTRNGKQRLVVKGELVK